MRANSWLSRLAVVSALAVAIGVRAPAGQAICPSKGSRPGASGPSVPPAPPPGSGVPAGQPPSIAPRAGGTRAQDALDDVTWETWWALNRAVLLPPLARQARAPGDATYAATLAPRLREAVDVLIEALGDADDQVVEAAAAALAVVRTPYRAPDAQAALLGRLDAGDAWRRDLCALALAQRGVAEVAPTLRRVLLSGRDEPVSRAFAAFGLIALGDAAGLELVARATRDLDEPEVAGAVLIALGQTGDLHHLPLLTEALERRAGAATRLRRVRADALIALGKLGHPATVPLLAGLLEDREKAIARSAALALGGFHGEAAALCALRDVGLASPDPFVQAFAAVSLGRLGDAAALPALARLLEGSPVAGTFALLGLGLLHTPMTAPFLERPLAERPRSGVLAAAALAAGLTPAPQALPQLVPAVGDLRTAVVPSSAALGVALLGAREHLEALQSVFWLDGARVRPGLGEAAARLDPERHAAWLLGALGKATHSGERRALVEALGLCGGPDEAAALVRLWRAAPTGDGELRVQTLRALARIVTDREPSFAARLRAHTCYLQPNLVLDHLQAFP